ncbi:MAG: hypothetical protein BWY19_00765 [bacterium ADurb.Bin212]|nr:MAG: hypothetical protein BWY19_00765 [bacterium ADurb.Bin212]
MYPYTIRTLAYYSIVISVYIQRTENVILPSYILSNEEKKERENDNKY